jgi:hypothetical protein
MSTFQPPPTWADPVLVNPVSGKSVFNPVWLQWFVDFTARGGNHNTLQGLQGGQADEYYHLTKELYTALAASTLYHGQFVSLVNQTVAATTRKAVDFEVSISAAGVTQGTPTSRITFPNPGRYNLSFQAQTSGIDVMTTWLVKKGVDVANSQLTKAVGATGWLVRTDTVTVVANDYYEYFWATTGGVASLAALAASGAPVYPAAYSANVVIQGLI